jgi:hypothetical protein
VIESLEIMELYPGVDLIECGIAGRLLYLPLWEPGRSEPVPNLQVLVPGISIGSQRGPL